MTRKGAWSHLPPGLVRGYIWLMVLLVSANLLNWIPMVLLGVDRTPGWVSEVVLYLMVSVALGFGCAAMLYIKQLKRLRGKACWKCHYILDLETNSERCPECGMETAISMANWHDAKWLGK